MDWAKQVRSLNRRFKKNARLTRGQRRRDKERLRMFPEGVIDNPSPFDPARPLREPEERLDYDEVRSYIERSWDEAPTEDDD